MKRFFSIALIIASLVFITSCDFRTETLKPKVSGLAGEVILVMSQADWDSGIGDECRKILSTDLFGLPQSEPVFDVIHVTPERFDNIFTSHRNIITVKTNPHFTEPKIVVLNDQWSFPQLVINVTAATDSTCINLLSDNANQIVDRINVAERERVMINYKRYQEAGIYNALVQKYNVSLTIPKGYNLDVDSSNFIWISNETPLVSQGIFVYFYPYTDEANFLPEELVSKRNQFLKDFVEGPSVNTWMTTEDILPPDYSEFEHDGRYYAKLRGLWKLENGFMGGPFISLSTVDEKRQRIVTVDGYVYAPSEEKREFLRQVESILYSLEILD